MRPTTKISPLLLAAIVPLWGCPGGAPAGDHDGGSDAGAPLTLGIPPQCNPLRGDDPKDCATPWPAFTYELPSASTASGYAVDVPAGVLPTNAQGSAVDPTLIDALDGFSPAGPLVVHFSRGIAPGNLPGWQNLAQSVAPASPTQILDPSGSRVLHFSELDATVTDASRQGLFIRPMVRLQPKTRYVAVLLKTLLDPSGNPLPIPAGMAALLSGTPTDDARLEAWRPDFAANVLPVLAKAGIPTKDVLLAWDFTTASDELLTSHLLSMRDQALLAIGDGSQIPYTIDAVDDGTPDAGLAQDAGPALDGGADGGAAAGSGIYERLTGHFQVPLFLTAGDESGTLILDGGVPVMNGSYPVRFAAIVPSQIETATSSAPLPVLVFGHGLLGDAVAYSYYPALQAAAEAAGIVMVFTNWTGLSAQDQDIAGLAVADLNQLPEVTDKLQQAVVNQIALGRFAWKELGRDGHLQPNGADVLSTSAPYYYGISLGGIMGDTFMAYDPDITQGVLNVPGGCWSLLLQRSTNWAPLAGLFQASYPDGVDQALLTAYLQALFDYSDPITTAPYVLKAPLAGVPPKQLLMQEGRYDMQVSNLATEMTARTLGISLITPSDDLPVGIPTAAAPLPSGLTIYDLEPSREPNVTNALNTQDNGVHDGVSATAAAARQVDAFLKPGGVVTEQCSGSAGCICAPPQNACQ
ncbi:MAG: hypothetical protein ACYCWW_14020 [Deltaproteobacteria bacterium]